MVPTARHGEEKFSTPPLRILPEWLICKDSPCWAERWQCGTLAAWCLRYRRSRIFHCPISVIGMPICALQAHDILASTTGFGRMLDAVSCHLGICQKRSYDGEPAMKLEPFLERGRRSVPLVAERRSDIIQTVDLFRQLTEARGSREDLAHSFVAALLESMVDAAADTATEQGVGRIGLTGGVSYNGTIAEMVKDMVERRGLEFVCPACPTGTEAYPRVYGSSPKKVRVRFQRLPSTRSGQWIVEPFGQPRSLPHFPGMRPRRGASSLFILPLEPG